jgi:hypothetical protein
LLPGGKVKANLGPRFAPFPLFIFLSMVNYGNFQAGFGLRTHQIFPTNEHSLGLLNTPHLR